MKRYRVQKIDSRDESVKDYGGGWTEEDVKLITKGYKWNGFFYDRRGSHYFYMIEEEQK